jgi:hypothetical protein
MSIMRYSQILAMGLASAVGLISASLMTAQSPAQTAGGATASQAAAPGMKCNGTFPRDPFKGKLAGPDIPAGLLPIDDKDKSDILKSGLPCQENVSPRQQADPASDEGVGLENLQRGFDFYSWRTFIALNSPADGSPIEDGQPNTPTRWEDMDNFKQLLDVMLPADQQPPIWPRDRAGMDAERERLMPEACKTLQQNDPTLRDRKIVKMIEESYNEPFKTGPLIDQDGHYAIFDILMNREMFDYITEHHLNTKAGQAANADLAVDFPAGQNDVPAQAGKPAEPHKFGAFMLKVSWKILSDAEKAAKTFHMIDALVLMPPNADRPETARRCLPRTLGLVGFHAVHKTVSRPQWIWTTFEHVKNVPDKDEVAANKLADHYNFFDAGCKSGCPVNATPPRPWEPSPALELSFRVDNSYRSQIVRQTPLTDAAKHMNAIFHSLLPPDNVWQNYMLISTQWPSAFAIHCTGLHSQSPLDPKTDFVKQPDMTCSPAPNYLANSTLETYSQADNKVEKQTDENGVLPDDLAVPLATSSCIACHSNAVGFQRTASNREAGRPNLNQSDFTFMLEKAQ